MKRIIFIFLAAMMSTAVCSAHDCFVRWDVS